MHHPSALEKAQNQIQAAQGKKLSIHERKEASIALAATILEEAKRIQTSKEKEIEAQLARMMADPVGKVFTAAMTDQCFRTQQPQRTANQLSYLLQKYGIPKYLSEGKKLGLRLFKLFGTTFAKFSVSALVRLIRKETSAVILPGEEKALAKHIISREKEGVRVNLNHLGEAILGEEEAQHRLDVYLKDLTKPEVEYISVKISTIYSQINLLAWEETLEALANNLRKLYRAAIANPYTRSDGTKVPKFVNLDMEEYRDLNLTVALFKKVLDEHEFHNFSAGIVLQAYLPDSFLYQQELTIWAIQRVMHGGASIKIRIVKGANLAMEQVEASMRLWPQAPYSTKAEVDANYKRMLHYGCTPDHAYAVQLGIASHNLFDIAYALLLVAENRVENDVCFEMLEGMADHIRRAVQKLCKEMLLYCPAAKKEEFQNAVAYLIRRLDENTASENFLHDLFNLAPGTPQWKTQIDRFSQACSKAGEISYLPRRTQNRLAPVANSDSKRCFQNEPDTDWSLSPNRKWAEKILEEWTQKKIKPIPLVIGDDYIGPGTNPAFGNSPSSPGQTLYQFTLATTEQAEKAIQTAKQAESSWAKSSVKERSSLLKKIAQGFRQRRADLIGAMVLDAGKTIPEADIEVSEAIDFAEYYARNLEEWSSLPDIQWTPKGTVLVAPPWNFPCSIPAGGILAALAAGNCVIFKPPSESVLVGWHVAKVIWDAGVSSRVMQFITCEDEPVGSTLVKDLRINAIILTGATETAKLFLQMRPGLDLMAETGGKNTMVITAMADRDLAIKDLLQSAFGHTGQKCSACSLAILEAEVYDDPHFRQQLRDAAASLVVGPSTNLNSRIPPLIRPASHALLQGLIRLEEGEEWLLEPKQDPTNPNLWSPGIKLGVKSSSFTFQTELFGPVLGLVRANNFNHALKLMNMTRYGLTAGIHTLDEREQNEWLKQIEAGNCYINRTITGAIVQRQPFGGCKESGFGKGAKAGGPNYLSQLMNPKQVSIPQDQEKVDPSIQNLGKSLSPEEKKIWEASIGSYGFYFKHYFSKKHDPSKVLGQDNLQCYVPRHKTVFRIQEGDSPLDILRVIAASMTCNTTLQVSGNGIKIDGATPRLTFINETNETFVNRLQSGDIEHLRLLKSPSPEIQEAISQNICHLNIAPVMANGRLELLHYLREVSVSRDYHRYGNLGDRENEKRDPSPECNTTTETCGACECHPH